LTHVTSEIACNVPPVCTEHCKTGIDYSYGAYGQPLYKTKPATDDFDAEKVEYNGKPRLGEDAEGTFETTGSNDGDAGGEYMGNTVEEDADVTLSKFFIIFLHF
jgi:hypothetical protein